jgi:mannose/fructose/N-acetylgalactosamine-specific phosphotransferase system component IIB
VHGGGVETMPIVLYRVDERLIHGQVVVGWGTRLHTERIVVVDDALSGSSWEQELYSLGLPATLAAEFLTVAEARARLAELRTNGERTVVLTRDIETMLELARGGLLANEPVNIGGIHFQPGRTQVLPYVYLSDDERAELRHLAEEGVAVSAQDLPGARAVELTELLG